MRKIIVGNWKMHGGADMARAWASSVSACVATNAEVVICPPVTLIAQMKYFLGNSEILLGGQDCSAEAQGAYTGDISASMLKDTGCAYVIVGHSERRQYHRETNAEVRKKAAQALHSGLKPIICVGETLHERESGKATAIVAAQVMESVPEEADSGDFVLAYEPVWAIGSGRTPTILDIQDMHRHIMTVAGGVSVIYGGSVKPGNAQEILAIQEVAGVLVGGASLKAEEFCKIVASVS